MTMELQATGTICQYHMSDHAVIGDLRDAVKVIIEGQQEMRSSVIQLTEAFKNMDRIERRLEKIEDERKRQEELRDKEVRELRAFMNKAIGYTGATLAIAGIALKFI